MNCIKKNKILIIIIILLIFLTIVGAYLLYKKSKEYDNRNVNNYNYSFTNLVNYMNKVESLLAKATISKDISYSAETLIQVWKEANLGLVYLNQIPVNSENISQTSKFLNQVSDYCYTLYKKNINDEELSDEDFKNLSNLHKFCMMYEETLNELSEELLSGKINWNDLDSKDKLDYVQYVDNIDILSNIDSNLSEYEGLIYDGAYSDHVNKNEKLGLTGNNIDENQAYDVVKNFFEGKKIEKISLNSLSENTDIECYNFSLNFQDEEAEISISITKKGGFVLEMQNNRKVEKEEISQEKANEIGREFLGKMNFKSMEATYYTKLYNTVTINYAYVYDDIIVYPDLIKVKIALDNGEVIGIETEGYINSHTSRIFENENINIENAREKINTNLEILSERMAIIPTKLKTEVLCYEFKGKVDNREFLVYINAKTGKEEDILVILDTPGGTLTI